MAQAKPAQNPALSGLPDLLHRAAGLHQCGALDQAEKLYQQVLDRQPQNFDALHLYGLLKHQQGRSNEALFLLVQAVHARPQEAIAHYNKGAVLMALHNHAEALASYDATIALKPDYAEAHLNRGRCLMALKRDDEALASFDHALIVAPSHAAALKERARWMREHGRPDEALASLDEALAVTPHDAVTHANRGLVLRDLARFEEALGAYAQALAIRPDHVDALVSRGDIFNRLRRYEEAVAEYDRALALVPDPASDGHARGLAPFASAAVNRGVALRYLDRAQDAMASFERATALAPNMPEAPYNKALLQLANGDFANGWTNYEWRWRGAPELKPRDFAQPQWRGEDLAGKTIFLHAEQGYGDSIQFLRYLPLLKAKGAKVILDLPQILKPLLGGLTDGVMLPAPGTVVPAFDYHCPLMSLALAFGTTLETIPADLPYLSVPEARLAPWRVCLTNIEQPRIGLAWSGRPSHVNDHNRSIPLAGLAPLFALPGVSFISLQRDYRDSDLADLGCFPILRFDDSIADFADTAAIIDQLDLVITVDTAVAHLAGALGKPVWIMLPRVPDWRWLLERDDSPWYPSARLFRQAQIGDWCAVVDRVAATLSAEMPTSS